MARITRLVKMFGPYNRFKMTNEDGVYTVRDAALLTDAQVYANERPPVVAQTATEATAEAAAMATVHPDDYDHWDA